MILELDNLDYYDQELIFTVLLSFGQFCLIDDRVKKLNDNTFRNCFLYENELVKEAIKKYLNWYSDNSTPTFNTILCNYNVTIKNLR